MMYPGTSAKTAGRGAACLRFLITALAIFAAPVLTGRAALRFDVFPGYGFEKIIPEASWFPITCEILNDGPAFVGTIEVTGGQFHEGMARRLTVELPTGTLKRVVIPVFSSARYSRTWEVRLLDERDRVRATDQSSYGASPGRLMSSSAVIVGAIPRTPAGMPVIRPVRAGQQDIQPAVARIEPAYISDNPLVLEGMDVLYLNSGRATGLDANQVEALLTWVNGGGHLIIAVEQISDVNGVNWLRKIVPCDLTDIRPLKEHSAIQDWLRAPFDSGDKSPASRAARRTRTSRFTGGYRTDMNPFSDAPTDPDFEKAEMSVAVGTPGNARVLASAGDTPLIVTSRLGEGKVTALLFSPEREPFRSWKNLQSFWARLFEVPPELYMGDNYANQGNYSIDGVFGAMIDSKQIRKLPVEWLLLLLVVYLLVIGPVDQYWLKRIRRPMLTWITFPCYVVMFSLMIYFIGYKLRAGETEWNELHIVDVLKKGDAAELRGRTYASIYSPVNATYKVEGQERYAAFRGEFQNPWGGNNQDTERAEIYQAGDDFKGSIFVPVWTSQLYMSDWWQPSQLPVSAAVASEGENWVVTVTNHRDRALNDARIVIGDRIMTLGNLNPGQARKFTFPHNEGTPLHDYVRTYAAIFQNVSNQRQHVFGASGAGRLNDLTNSCVAVSFISRLDGEGFVTPPGLDLSRQLEQGNAVLLAWESDFSPVKPMNQFPTRRGHKDTLWRLSIPVTSSAL